MIRFDGPVARIAGAARGIGFAYARFLAERSRDCCESGWVLRASNGQFHAVRPAEASGVDYPRDLRAVAADNPEAVAAAWSRSAVSEPERR